MAFTAPILTRWQLSTSTSLRRREFCLATSHSSLNSGGPNPSFTWTAACLATYVMWSTSPSREERPFVNLEDEVGFLVERARGQGALNLALRDFLTLHGASFITQFRRQVDLIKSRSQEFEAGQITVFDKALLALTQGGSNLKSPAAISFYCLEYLGIDVSLNSSETFRALQGATDVPVLLSKAVSPDTSGPPKCESGVGPGLPEENVPNQRATTLEPTLYRLWTVFERAKEDFEAVAGKGDEQSVVAAKFLRDTAENTLQYFESKNVESEMMKDLRKTYNMAKAMAVSLTGGKKRKFDGVGMGEVKGLPRRPAASVNSQRNQTGRVTYEPMRIDRQPNVTGLFEAHDRRRSVDPTSGHGSMSTVYHAKDSSEFRGRELLPAKEAEEYQGQQRVVKFTHGRGHSGIPYGYSRYVDSYHPGSGRAQ